MMKVSGHLPPYKKLEPATCQKVQQFCRKNSRNFAKNSRNYTKNLSDFGKKLKRLKKTQGYEALLGLLGLQKVHKKQAWIS